MNNQQISQLNDFISEAYECLTFSDFLKHAIMKLHKVVMFDSGMFFCAISRDCSFFKPYLTGAIENYYEKKFFSQRETYFDIEKNNIGKEAYVYKSEDLRRGVVRIEEEPRNHFLVSQENFYIVCIRIVYKNKFMGEIYLHRSLDKPDFDIEEMFILQLLQPHVSNIFNIIHTVSAVQYLEENKQVNSRKGICVFDSELFLTGGNATGVEMLKVVTVYGSSILYHIKEFCGDIIDPEKKSNRNSAVYHSKALKTAGADLNIDIFVKYGKKFSSDKQFIILMEFCNSEQLTTEYKFKFSIREAEIIDGIIQGKNNAQLAHTFRLSENTIKTHIKNIYKKTGTNNRAELTYLLMLNN